MDTPTFGERSRKELEPSEIWKMLTESPVIVFNAMRKERPGQPIDLSDADITGFQLAGIDLRNADLRQTNFRDVDLSGADFRGAKLDEARFVNCTLDGTLFDGNKDVAEFVQDK